jgi:Gluconate 2-dehydrogenase subunit 3
MSSPHPESTTASRDTPLRGKGVSRRAALRRLGVGVGAFAAWPYLSEEAAEAFVLLQKTKAAPKLVFLSPAQYATVEVLTEAIIPADDHSPGAKAARVPDYIDLLLSESAQQTKKTWTEGLAELDRLSQERFQVPFAKLAADQTTALLTEISKNETSPTTPLEQFFAATKNATIRGYYSSEIGIHKELEYKGNQFLPEFVGCTHPEHGYETGKSD